MILEATDFTGLLPLNVKIEPYIAKYEYEPLPYILGDKLAYAAYTNYNLGNPTWDNLFDGAEYNSLYYKGLKEVMRDYVMTKIVHDTGFMLTDKGVKRGVQDLAETTNAGLLISMYNTAFLSGAYSTRLYVEEFNKNTPEWYPDDDFSFDLTRLSENRLGV